MIFRPFASVSEYRVSLMPIFSNELRICSGVRPNSRSIATAASEL